MKTLRFDSIALAIAAMAVGATPAAATDLYVPMMEPAHQPMVMGDFSFDAGAHFTRDEEGEEWTKAVVSGEARVYVPLHGGDLLLQLDARARGDIYEDGYGDAESTFLAHAWHKQETSAYGLFGGVAFAGYGTPAWSIGAEGEHYFGNTTIGASAGYSFGNGEYGWEPSAFTVAGSLDHYLNPDHKLSISFDYDWYENYETDLDIVVAAEKRMTGTAFSAYVEGGYSAWTENGCCDGSRWSATVGGRILLDAPGMTLQEHDRYLPWESVRTRPAFWGGIL